MLKTLIDFFIKDIRWKLIALGAALMLWFVGVNVNNPTETKPFTRYLTLINQEFLQRSSVALLNENELKNIQVNVGIRAQRSALNVLDAMTSNIVVYIDLSRADIAAVKQSDTPVTHSMYVDVSILPNYERMNRWPIMVDVVLDQIVSQVKTIQVYTTGEVEAGFEMQKPVSTLTEITVSGPRSVVNTVSTVYANISVQDANKSVTSVEKLGVYDKDNNDITDSVTLSAETTEITVPVLPYKVIPLMPLLSGQTAPGYTVLSATVTPPEVEIVGTARALEKIKELMLETVNLNNADRSFTHVVDIRQLLAGTDTVLRENMPTEVEIAVVIEPLIEKEFLIPLSAVLFTGPPPASYALSGADPLSLTLRGPESEIVGLTLPRLNPQINVTGLNYGEHTVTLSLTLPKNVRQIGTPLTVVVTIPDPEAEDVLAETNE